MAPDGDRSSNCVGVLVGVAHDPSVHHGESVLRAADHVHQKMFGVRVVVVDESQVACARSRIVLMAVLAGFLCDQGVVTGRPGEVGDDWVGSDFIDAIESPEDLTALSLNHGMCADSKQCCKREISEPKIIYWEENREKLRDPKFRIIETMRHKQMLFTYLERVPKQFGFEPFFPFKDMELAAAMLNLPQKRRRDRVWQQDFFRRNNIMMEDSCRVRRLPNDLSIRALDIVCPPPLDVKVLSEVVRPEYVEWINRYIRPTSLNRLQEVLLSVRGAGRVTKIFTGRIPKTVRMRASFAYRVLYPIERLLKSRI